MSDQSTINNPQTTSPRVVIAGGTGLIGSALVQEFKGAGYDVVVLSRHGKPVDGAKSVAWDAKTLTDWPKELEGATAVINLVGEPIDQRWTDENKRRIVESRVESTRAIGEAVAQASDPPGVWVNMSAIGYYGDTGERAMAETDPPGQGFMAEVCRKWEAAMQEADTPKTRQVRVRTGVVLTKKGGVLGIFVKLVNGFIGGSAGSGRQLLSWIHIEDLTRLFRWCAENPGVAGPVNGVAPRPVSNKDFMATLRKVLGRPWAPPAPTPVLLLATAIIGKPASAILDSAGVVPAVALREGFAFKHPELEAALRDLLQAH